MRKEIAIIVILSALLIATNMVWFVLHFYEPDEWHLVYDRLNTTPYPQTLYTDAFEIKSDEWFIEWHWNGQPESWTRLFIEVYDAYSDYRLQTLHLYPESPKHYLNIKGRFYLSLSINQEGLTLSVEVWEL